MGAPVSQTFSRLRMHNFLTVFLVALCALAGPTICMSEDWAQGYVVSSDSRGVATAIDIPVGDSISVDLELGEWSGDFTLITNPPAAYSMPQKDNLVVQQRGKRCLSISGEGPHLDFRDWKSDISPWKDMARVGWNKWKGIPIPDKEYSGFPDYTVEELEEEVRRTTKGYGIDGEPDFWLKLARDCKKDNGASCSVGLCETEIRFLAREKGTSRVIRTVRLLHPQGC